MKQQQIKNELIAWFKIITSRFQWISVKYEYSDKLKSFLVSFSPSDKINESDEFCIEAMRFENEMNEKYGDNAPLFCDDEKYFTLSEHAEVIQGDNNTFTSTIKRNYNMMCDDIKVTFNIHDDHDLNNPLCSYRKKDNIIKLAA